MERKLLTSSESCTAFSVVFVETITSFPIHLSSVYIIITVTRMIGINWFGNEHSDLGGNQWEQRRLGTQESRSHQWER